MDTNTVLPAFAALFCFIMLVRLLRRKARDASGWIVVLVLMLVLTGAAYYFANDEAALISGVPFLFLVVAPLVGTAIANRLIVRQRYQAASVLTGVSYRLHPFDNWGASAAMTRALALGAAGQFAEAQRLLKQFGHPDLRAIGFATCELLRMRGQWEAILHYCKIHPALTNDPLFVGFYLRACGETGDPNAMLRMYHQVRAQQKHQPAFGSMLLFIFAFCGRRKQVEQIFQNSLREQPDAFLKSWLATAELAAGNEEVGRQLVGEGLALNDRRSQPSLRRRLDYPLPVADTVLTPESCAVLAAADEDLVHLMQFEKQTSADRTRVYATYALIAVNCVVFALEIVQGGSENVETLVKLGALVPGLVLFSGEWWRLLGSMFLHLGILHLGMNMLGLLAIGPFVERILGRVRFLLTYFIAGLGPGLILVLMAQSNLIDLSTIAVGASGAIMGILGAEAAIMLRGWRANKSTFARQRFAWIVVLFVLEAVFDLAALSPASLFAHLCGVLFGFLAASLQRHRASRRIFATSG